MRRAAIGGTVRRTGAGLALAAIASAPAFAAEDGQVVSGEATFTQNGSVLQIDTATPQTIINWWGGFDIAPGTTVQINQPSSLSNTLNQDLSSDPTWIQGTLLSNGGVWIANPVGVFFGDQAIVDVGRLVAGAGTVDAEAFLAGVERFDTSDRARRGRCGCADPRGRLGAARGCRARELRKHQRDGWHDRDGRGR